MHLSAVNPHIVGTLESAKRPGIMHLPRMAGGARGGAVGISGFAFQGTNAHVITDR